MKKNRKSILKRSVLSIVIVGIVILAAVCAVAGIIFYRVMGDVYADFSYAYSMMATMEIYTEDLGGLILDKDTLETLRDKYILVEEEGEDPDLFTEEEWKLFESWAKVDLFLAQTVAYNDNLKTFQIVVPAENEVVCIWYETEDAGISYYPLMRRPYRKGEKEDLEKKNQISDLSEEKIPDKLTIYTEDGEILGTATFPIYWNSDGEEKVIAFAELDMSITSIRTAIFILVAAIAGLILIIMGICLILYFMSLKKRVISPILRLNQAADGAVDRLKEGECPIKVEVHTEDELETLADSFDLMGENLQRYIQENAAITAERERINTELNLAASIQADMLPSVFPPFPERPEFEIYASMKPAKEVGGDFYDYFFVDENTLVLVIADVSGKGVPASLFMMRSMIAIENLAANDRSPAVILDKLNQQICANNKSAMFVTVWLGILDVKTGHLTAANAGHEYPLISQPDGQFELYKDRHSFVVGGKKKMKFQEYELSLVPGSQLFLYSDGLPEAKNPEGELFRITSVLNVLNSEPGGTPEEVIEAVSQSVNDFVQGAESFDDLTMMCIRYHGDGSPDRT